MAVITQSADLGRQAPRFLGALWWHGGRALRVAPLTTAYLLWLILAAGLVHLLPADLRVALDAELVRPGVVYQAPWTVLTSMLVPTGPLDPPLTPVLVWNVVALVGLGLGAERRLGRRRLITALIAGQVGATLLTAAFGWAGEPLFPHWSQDIRATAIAGPAVAYVAAAAAATATLPRLWRRRLRVTAGTVLITMVLYHGGSVSLFVVFGAVVGRAIGKIFLRGRRSEPNPRGSWHERRVLVALVVAASGVGPLIGAALGFGDGPLAVLGAFIARPDPYAAELLAGGCPPEVDARECAIFQLTVAPSPGLLLLTCVPAALLLVAALGLRRGRRTGWALAVAVQAVLTVFFVATFVGDLIPSGDDVGAPSMGDAIVTLLPCLSPIVVLAVLARTRRLFAVASSRVVRARLAARVAAALLALVIGYVGGGLAVAEQWTEPATAGQLLADVPRRLLPLEYLLPLNQAFPALLPEGPVATVLYSWLGLACWVVIILALLDSLARALPATAALARARAGLIRYGGGSLAWMGLWEGNVHWFSTDGRSYVPYRVIGGVALTTGDPVGPGADRDQVLTDFLAFADASGWTVCFYSATQELADTLLARGWEGVQIAEEAVLDLPGLAFTGKRFQDVRTAFNHLRRDGLSTRWATWRKLPLPLRVQIREISEQWVAEQTLPEMGFTLGGLEELDDPDVRLLLLLEPSEGAQGAERVHGVASWLPIHAGGGVVTGWTLDFMRRRADGFRFTMEVLIGQAALDLQQEGYAELSLSGAPLARVEHEAGAPPPPRGFGRALTRVLDSLGRSLEPVYGFRSLLRFKAKFRPRYRALYMLYPDPATLPAIGSAIARAYLPTSPLGVAWQLRGRLRSASREAGRQAADEATRAAVDELSPHAAGPATT
ncbi:MAG: DUF2156 domain-containing protein [Dermatophilaceae bacterium]